MDTDDPVARDETDEEQQGEETSPRGDGSGDKLGEGKERQQPIIDFAPPQEKGQFALLNENVARPSRQASTQQAPAPATRQSEQQQYAVRTQKPKVQRGRYWMNDTEEEEEEEEDDDEAEEDDEAKGDAMSREGTADDTAEDTRDVFETEGYLGDGESLSGETLQPPVLHTPTRQDNSTSSRVSSVSRRQRSPDGLSIPSLYDTDTNEAYRLLSRKDGRNSSRTRAYSDTLSLPEDDKPVSRFILPHRGRMRGLSMHTTASHDGPKSPWNGKSFLAREDRSEGSDSDRAGDETDTDKPVGYQREDADMVVVDLQARTDRDLEASLERHAFSDGDAFILANEEPRPIADVLHDQEEVLQEEHERVDEDTELQASVSYRRAQQEYSDGEAERYQPSGTSASQERQGNAYNQQEQQGRANGSSSEVPSDQRHFVRFEGQEGDKAGRESEAVSESHGSQADPMLAALKKKRKLKGKQKRNQSVTDAALGMSTDSILSRRVSNVRSSRRQHQLRSVGDLDDLSKQNLHRLFRLFDINKDGKLDHYDVQSGLLAMGIDEAGSTMAVRRIIESIDLEGDGMIRENEFVQFFSMYSMDNIRKQMKILREEDAVSLEIISFDSTSDDVSVQTVNRDDLKEWLHDRDAYASSTTMDWIIIKGYDDDACRILGDHLGIHEETYQDVVTLQRDKIEVVSPEEQTPVITQTLMAIYSLDNSPFSKDNPNYVNPGVSRLNSSEEHPSFFKRLFKASWFKSPDVLVSKRHLDTNPPLLSSYPISNINIGNNLLITIIRDGEFLFDSTRHKRSASSPVYEVINTVRDQILDKRSYLIDADCIFLSYLILEAVTERNYDLRDQLKTWLSVIDDRISEKPSKKYRAHLFDFGKALASFARELSALRDALQDLDFQDETDAEAAFFSDQRVYLRDLYDQVETIMSELNEMQEITHNMFQLYQSYQDEQMNQFLLVLTMVTTVFIPAQFLTGLWGMNFENMPELTLKHGYTMFWCLVIILTILILVWFKAKGFWLIK